MTVMASSGGITLRIEVKTPPPPNIEVILYCILTIILHINDMHMHNHVGLVIDVHRRTGSDSLTFPLSVGWLDSC